MKFSSGSLQLNLPIQPSKRAASRDDLPDQLARLTPAERTILQLKALVGIATNKNDFLALLNRSGIPMPGGGSWSYNSVNPILNRLLALGLLKPDLSCVDTLCHDLTVEAIAAPGGRVAAEAVRRMFPVAANRPYYHSYSPQTDPGARVRLRLTIYENDADGFRVAILDHDKDHNWTTGPHILETLFADAILDASWLDGLALDIQFRLFWVKFSRLLTTGESTPDMPALMAHYRAREDKPGYAQFKWALLRVDILAGNLVAARRKILAMPEEAPETRPSTHHLLLASVTFLEGDNTEALAEYRLALKLYKKEIGKRKAAFDGFNGLFFLLALIRADDSSLHHEIQANLDAIDYESSPFIVGFQAIQALLFLLRGTQAKARTLLNELREMPVREPVSAACLSLIEFLIDPQAARAQIEDTRSRFAALAPIMPLVARIHAEILARISDRPAPYEAFLRDRSPSIAFAELVKLQQPWERGFESLANFLGAGAPGPVKAPAAPKSRRLVWFVDPEAKRIEAVEQSVKGANGWTSGRNVLGFHYIIRIRCNIHVSDADGETRLAADWVGQGGRARKLRDSEITAARQKVGAVVCVKARGMKEAWHRAASDGALSAAKLSRHKRPALWHGNDGPPTTNEHRQAPRPLLIPTGLSAL